MHAFTQQISRSADTRSSGPSIVLGAVLASALPGEEQGAPGEEGHLAQACGLREGFQRRFLLKPKGTSQGKGILGRRNDKMAWHLVRTISDWVLLEPQVQV